MTNNDMLIKLYDMEFDTAYIKEQAQQGVSIRKPIGPDRSTILAWAKLHFPQTWLDEIARALDNRPCSCFVAQRESSLLGVACYDATALGFFGPLGVIEKAQRCGIGRALTLASLMDMRLKGYGYAVVGMAEAMEFYEKVAGATEIPDSYPGIYRSTLNLLKNL
jgi:ribosomal protein S18 acetylase RimI-like enzyme